MERIGIIVEEFEDNPHETEGINAIILKKELESFGCGAYVFYFRGKGTKRDFLKFDDALFKKMSAFYLSGSVSKFNFLKIILLSFFKRTRIHFRIPSYNLESLKFFSGFFKFLIKINLLKVYSFDRIHQKKIRDKTGIETEILEPCVNLTDKPGINNRKNTDVLFIGSKDDYSRGLPELLGALRILKKTRPKIKLKIINKYGIYTDEKIKSWKTHSSGKLVDVKKEILERVKKFELEKNVFLSGKSENIENEYKKARVYVLPVKRFRKMPPIPYSILESLYLGTPVISSDIYGIKFLIDKKFLLKENFDEKELAGRIHLVLKEKPKVSLKKKFLPREAAKKFLKFVDGKA